MNIRRAACERAPHLALVTAHYGTLGGMERFARFLLNTTLTAGWHVTVALSGKNIFEELAARFGGRLTVEPVGWVDDTSRGDREYAPRRILERRRWFRRARPDAALFVQSFNTPFRASVAGAALAGIPIVTTHRTMAYPVAKVPSRRHLFGLLPGLGLYRRRTAFKTWLTSALASRVVYNSQQVREAYEHQYRYAVRKGVVIPNAATAPAAACEPAGNHPAGAVTIGYLGRLHASKCVDVLLRATAVLRQRNNNVRLLIYGDGPQREELAALAGQLGLGGLVEWGGYVEDVWPVYQRCDIVALCSRQESESSSNMIVEAMSIGKPVVVTRIAGLEELVEYGQAGLVVEPDDVDGFADALERLVASPQERAALGARARESARRLHDPAAAGRAWLAVLDGVIGRERKAERGFDVETAILTDGIREAAS